MKTIIALGITVLLWMYAMYSFPAFAAEPNEFETFCATKWPTNFEMQKYCDSQQLQGIQDTKDFLERHGLSMDTAVLAFVQGNAAAIIFYQCLGKWKPNFEMTAYCIKQQEQAAEQLGKL